MITSPYPKEDLGELCHINIGKTPSRHNPAYWGSGHPWLSIADMGKRELHDTKEQITDIAIKECGCRIVPENTLLMSFKLSIGKLGFTQKPMFTNEAIASLPVKNPKKLTPEYLYRALQMTDLLSGTDRAVMGATLNKDKLYKIKIPLPPLDEQKRIAGILDKADAIRRKRAESLKLLDELLRATFLDMFGDPITNPKGLKKKPLKDFGTVVTGNTPSRADAENYGDYIEWIKSDNLNNPKHFLTKASEGLSEKGARKSRLLPSGSILVTCIAGSPSCIGNAGIADREVAFNQQINAVTPFPNVDLYFLYTQILVAKKLIQSASTNAMKGMINKSKFENIRLLDADENTQKKAGKIFKKIIHEHSVFSSATTESDTLFHSLVARAFKGEL